MILVFGIVGLVVCFPFGIAAWVLGNTDLREMDAGIMDPSGRPLTQAGRVIGMIATLMACAGLLIGAVFFLVGFMGAMMNGG